MLFDLIMTKGGRQGYREVKDKSENRPECCHWFFLSVEQQNRIKFGNK